MKKNFDGLRSQMGEARVVRSDKRAQKMLNELLAEGLESGESIPINHQTNEPLDMPSSRRHVQ